MLRGSQHSPNIGDIALTIHISMAFTYDNVEDLEISAMNIDIANATLEYLGEFFVRNFILLKRATNEHDLDAP